MGTKTIRTGVYYVGADDRYRRLFDQLIYLPDGTSYNAYLIQGSDKTALIDTVDPSKTEILLDNLAQTGVNKIDYIIANHAEQDHSGSLPVILQRYPDARIVCNPRCKDFLQDLLMISQDKFNTIEDHQTISLGDKTLEFIYFPWVHWPETMLTYLREDKILFSCDLFGSHLPVNGLSLITENYLYDAAKRYFAEIMMPFRNNIQRELSKLENYAIEVIAPSHGPLYQKPRFIIERYKDWVSGEPKNMVIIPYVSMHGSTQKMVEYLTNALAQRNVPAIEFDLVHSDIGRLIMALTDAATIVIGTPYTLAAAHPAVVYAAHLINALRPKTKFVSIIGSYLWGGKPVEQLTGMLNAVKMQMLPSVFSKEYPKPFDFQALDNLANTIAEKHKGLALPEAMYIMKDQKKIGAEV